MDRSQALKALEGVTKRFEAESLTLNFFDTEENSDADRVVVLQALLDIWLGDRPVDGVEHWADGVEQIRREIELLEGVV